MSAWGKSWGSAFGAAFGAAVLVTTPVTQDSSGGGIFRDPTVTTLFVTADSEQDIQLQIQQEDEAMLMVIAQLLANGAFG